MHPTGLVPPLWTIDQVSRGSLHLGRLPSPGFQQSGRLPRISSDRFGIRLRTLRKARGMTQIEMSIEFGIDRSFISDVERGKKAISLPLLEVIAIGFGLTMSDLLVGI